MLKFLLITFIVIYILGYIGKWFLSNWIKKMSNNQSSPNESQNKKEGEVTVNSNQNTKSNNRFKGEGDYIDYEDITD